LVLLVAMLVLGATLDMMMATDRSSLMRQAGTLVTVCLGATMSELPGPSLTFRSLVPPNAQQANGTRGAGKLVCVT
jgi:hypothetical protein